MNSNLHVGLVVSAGKHAGKVVPVNQRFFLIGRDARCHLQPASGEVSSYHCALLIEDSRVLVRDLNSRTGTRVNGQTFQGEMTLRHGDRLQIGPLVLQLSLGRSEAAPPSAPDASDEALAAEVLLAEAAEAGDQAADPEPASNASAPNVSSPQAHLARREQAECDSANYQLPGDKPFFNASEAAEAIVKKFRPAWLVKKNYLRSATQHP